MGEVVMREDGGSVGGGWGSCDVVWFLRVREKKWGLVGRMLGCSVVFRKF